MINHIRGVNVEILTVRCMKRVLLVALLVIAVSCGSDKQGKDQNSQTLEFPSASALESTKGSGFRAKRVELIDMSEKMRAKAEREALENNNNNNK